MKEKNDIISTANGRINYSLITSVKEGVTVYGVKIICDAFGEHEEFECEDVTTEIEDAKELLNLLCDYVVLPCTALDIINEFVDNKAQINV